MKTIMTFNAYKAMTDAQIDEFFKTGILPTMIGPDLAKLQARVGLHIAKAKQSS